MEINEDVRKFLKEQLQLSEDIMDDLIDYDPEEPVYAVYQYFPEINAIGIGDYWYAEEPYAEEPYVEEPEVEKLDVDEAYNTFYETLTEKDFEEICYEYNRENNIEYIEFDVDAEIKYFSKDTKELLDEYTKEEQRLIVLNFLDYPSNQIESEVVEKFEIDDVEFAGISCKLNFRYHH